jgi:hypothetical protein
MAGACAKKAANHFPVQFAGVIPPGYSQLTSRWFGQLLLSCDFCVPLFEHIAGYTCELHRENSIIGLVVHC